MDFKSIPIIRPHTYRTNMGPGCERGSPYLETFGRPQIIIGDRGALSDAGRHGTPFQPADASTLQLGYSYPNGLAERAVPGREIVPRRNEQLHLNGCIGGGGIGGGGRPRPGLKGTSPPGALSTPTLPARTVVSARLAPKL